MSIGRFPTFTEVQNRNDPLTALIFPLIDPFIPALLDNTLQRQQPLPRHFNLLTPSRMLRFQLLQATRPEISFQEVLREVWHSWRMAGLVDAGIPSSSALAQARSRLPVWPGTMLLKHTASLADLFALHPHWPHHRLLSIDGTYLCLPRDPQLLAHFGTTRNQYGDTYFPQALGVWVTLVQRQIVLAERLGVAKDTDETIAPHLLSKVVRPNDLILGDAHFGHYPTLSVIHSSKAFFLMRSPTHLTKKLDLLPKFDEIHLPLELSPDMSLKYSTLSLPPRIDVRALKYTIPSRDNLNGTEEAYFLTNLPAKEFTHAQLASIPPLRWNHETLNNDVKSRLGLGHIRSLSPDGVYHEILAHLCVSNVIRLYLAQSYPEALDMGSFTAAATAIRQSNQQLRIFPDRKQQIFDLLYEMILDQPVPHRPQRTEPRRLRPRRRPFDTFTTPRSDWREKRKAG